MIKLLKNKVKCQGHLKVKVIMKKLLEENETLTQIVNYAGHPPACLIPILYYCQVTVLVHPN